MRKDIRGITEGRLEVRLLKEDANVWVPIIHKAVRASDMSLYSASIFGGEEKPCVSATIYSDDPYFKAFLKDLKLLKIMIDVEIKFEPV